MGVAVLHIWKACGEELCSQCFLSLIHELDVESRTRMGQFTAKEDILGSYMSYFTESDHWSIQLSTVDADQQYIYLPMHFLLVLFGSVSD